MRLSTCILLLSLPAFLGQSCKKDDLPDTPEVTLDIYSVGGRDYANTAMEIDNQILLPIYEQNQAFTWGAWLLRLNLDGSVVSKKYLKNLPDRYSILYANLEGSQFRWGGEYNGYPMCMFFDSSATDPQLWTLDTLGRIYNGLSDNGFHYFCGEVNSPQGDKDILLLKFNSAGALITYRRIGSPENDGGIHLVKHGNKLTLLAYTYQNTSKDRDTWLMYLDDNLNITQEKVISYDRYEQPSRLLSRADGLVVFGHSTSGPSQTHDAWIHRVDESLNELSNKFISLGSHEGVDAIKVLNDGNIGLVSYGDMQIQSGLYLEVDQNMNLLHSKRYPDIAGFFYLTEFGDRKVMFGQTRGPTVQIARISDIIGD